jgi:hypothetical protein
MAVRACRNEAGACRGRVAGNEEEEEEEEKGIAYGCWLGSSSCNFRACRSAAFESRSAYRAVRGRAPDRAGAGAGARDGDGDSQSHTYLDTSLKVGQAVAYRGFRGAEKQAQDEDDREEGRNLRR